jgi:hypothetical protein
MEKKTDTNCSTSCLGTLFHFVSFSLFHRHNCHHHLSVQLDWLRKLHYKLYKLFQREHCCCLENDILRELPNLFVMKCYYHFKFGGQNNLGTSFIEESCLPSACLLALSHCLNEKYRDKTNKSASSLSFRRCKVNGKEWHGTATS